MCDPTGILVAKVGMSALTAGVGYAGQQEQANRQEVYNEELFSENERVRKDNQQLTTEAYNDEISSINLADNQITAIAAQDNLSLVKEALRATGLVKATSMSGGSGSSLLVADLERQEADYSHNVQRNLNAQIAQSRVQRKGARVRAINSIRSVKPFIPATVQHPSIIAAALPVVGSAVGAFDTYTNRSVR